MLFDAGVLQQTLARPTDAFSTSSTLAPLRSLAARLLAEEAPSLPAFPGRAWHEDSLLQAMQTYAAMKGDALTPAILAGCEQVGRLKARMLAERAVA